MFFCGSFMVIVPIVFRKSPFIGRFSAKNSVINIHTHVLYPYANTFYYIYLEKLAYIYLQSAHLGINPFMYTL